MHQLHTCSYLGGFFLRIFYASFVFGFLFGSIVFSVNNMTLSAFGCSSFVINLCELLRSFSSDSFQY